MEVRPSFPSSQHEKASETITEFFSRIGDVDAIVLYGSCARGKATKDSCLDFLILVPPKILSSRKQELERRWKDFYESEGIFKELLQVGEYSHVDLEFIDGIFKPRPHFWTGGPDDFELEIGNTLVYSKALWEGNDRFQRLKTEWLPYYGESLRKERLAEVKKFFLNNLDHIPLFIKRELYFQSFNRLYDAFREFLQALFISRRTYPIAYDKWIREQVVEILELPEVYEQLTCILGIENLETSDILENAESLRCLFEDRVNEQM